MYLLRLPIILLILSCLLTTQTSANEIYRWVDESGKIHFGDRKKQNIQQEKVLLKKHNSNWKKFNIEINDIDTILSPDEINFINEEVNNVYRFYDEVLYFDIYKTIPFSIRVFDEKTDYDKYLKSQNAKNSLDTLGVYFPRTNEIVVWNTKKAFPNSPVIKTIKHEASHAIVDQLTPYMPIWLNEGFAENMEELTIDNGQLVIKLNSHNFIAIYSANKREQKLLAHELIDLNHRDFQKSHRNSPNQAFTGELTKMLLNTESDRKFITRLIHLYSLGNITSNIDMVDKNYIGGISTLQNKWNKWSTRKKDFPIKL